MEGIIPLLIILPLAAAFGIVLMAQFRVLRRLAIPLAIIIVAAQLVVAALLVNRQIPPIFVGGWGAGNTLGIELVCDGLSTLMLIIINSVALASIVYAGAYMRRFTRVWLFAALFLLLTGAMNAVVLAGDMFNLFVFLEVAAIASYALVGFGCESEELEAAFKYLVLGTVGAAFVLVGVTILYSLTGHLNMARIASVLKSTGPSPAVMLAAAMLIGGLALKAAMVPFHAWLPDAHPSAPAPISAMLSGVLIKACGVYALARVVFNVLGPSVEYGVILSVIGAASMVIGVFLAVGQWDFKRLLAYHSISQMGYVVVAIGVAAQVMSAPEPNRAVAGLCLLGGMFHLLNHATFKSLLFLASGAIEQQTGTRILKEMGGLAKRMPITGFCCRVGALSIAGVPPFNGFLSKLIIIIGLAAAGQWVLTVLATLAALMTLLSFIKVQRYALEGGSADGGARTREAPALMCIAMIVLALVCIGAGFAFIPLRDYLLTPAADALLKGLTMGATP